MAGVVAIHAALVFALLNLSGTMPAPVKDEVMRLFDVEPEPPPPEPPPPMTQQPRPKDKEGGSAPKNIKSEATPVAAPTPRISLPVPVPIPSSKTPRQGTQPNQGAAPVPGPGTGAGGVGSGTGSGAGGSGTGGGGDGGVASPPRLVTRELTGRDFGRALLAQWPRGTPVFLRLRIDARGYVSECDVSRGTGVAAIDSVMCNLAHERLRFRPALNRMGQPVAGWVGYAQPPPR
ncbi:MAG TPA: energy transducer TonB [Sphingomicrobium sp.]|nr:energy transducer TonB [Sphingomicrobium sp.]